MKKTLVGLLALGGLSALADTNCQNIKASYSRKVEPLQKTLLESCDTNRPYSVVPITYTESTEITYVVCCHSINENKTNH